MEQQNVLFFDSAKQLASFERDGHAVSLLQQQPPRIQTLDVTGKHLDSGFHGDEPGKFDFNRLRCIVDYLQKAKFNIGPYEFVCWRGILKRIMFSCIDDDPHDHGLRFAAVMKSTIVWLREINTDEEIHFQQTKPRWQKMFTYGGFKMEEFLTGQPMEEKKDCIVLYEGQFKSTPHLQPDPIRILYAAEVDAQDDNNTFVEIKTHSTAIRPDQKFAIKALKWYIQSRLALVPKMIVGVHKNLQVTELHHFATEDMVTYFSVLQPNIQKACDETKKLLEKILATLRQNEEGKMLLVERKPKAKDYEMRFVTSIREYNAYNIFD